jgi:flagellar biosynthesis activator protein FlaF
MRRPSYAETLEGSSEVARRGERLAFEHGLRLLARLREADVTHYERIEAMLYMRRVWSFLIEDLGDPTNGLPRELRSTLISIGIWMIRESEGLGEGRTDNIDDMVAVMTSLRDGLA